MHDSSTLTTEAADLTGVDVEVMMVPVLSTVHVSDATRDMFNSPQPQWVHHCAKYEFGWFIAVPTEEIENALEPKPTDDLLALFAWARKNGFCWLRLDADGLVVSDLPTHAN